MKTMKFYIEPTFAQTEQEAENKLKAISNHPEISERMKDIKIGKTVKHDLEGYCAFVPLRLS